MLESTLNWINSFGVVVLETLPEELESD